MEIAEKREKLETRALPFPRFFAVFGYSAFSVLAIAALLELGAWSVYQALEGDRVAEVPARSPSYSRYAWAAEFWKEERTRRKNSRDYYVPFRIWGPSISHGKYVNTDQTELGTWRRTTFTLSRDCPQRSVVKVWMFGGSTVYGTGVPDSMTIPSFLAQKLNADHSGCVEVTNLGVEGYVTNQEVILLTELLKSGRHPDVVIFYDGVNDAFGGGFSPGNASAHLGLDLVTARVEGTLSGNLSFLQRSYSLRLARAVAKRLHKAAPAPLSEAEVRARAEATLNNYAGNLTIVRALADAYKFKPYFFWQPGLFYGQKHTVPFEKELVDYQSKAAGGQLWRAMQAVYCEAARRSAPSGSFVFLGGIFDQVDEAIYIDGMHLGPLGNEIVARELAQRIGLSHPE